MPLRPLASGAAASSAIAVPPPRGRARSGRRAGVPPRDGRARGDRRAALSEAAARRRRGVASAASRRRRTRAATRAASSGSSRCAQDVRHAWRALRRAPGYTVDGGAGAGHRHRRDRGADRGRRRGSDEAAAAAAGRAPALARRARATASRASGTPQRLRDWAASGVVESAAGVFSDSPVVRGDRIAAPERIDVMRMFGPLVETMGLAPVAGRLPTADETRGVGEPVVLLSHRFWRQRLGGARRRARDRPLTLDGAPHTVIGVLPAEAEKVFDVELWAPAPPASAARRAPAGFLSAVRAARARRLRRRGAERPLDVAATRLAQAYPATDRGRRRAARAVRAAPGAREARLPLLVLLSTRAAGAARRDAERRRAVAGARHRPAARGQPARVARRRTRRGWCSCTSSRAAS